MGVEATTLARPGSLLARHAPLLAAGGIVMLALAIRLALLGRFPPFTDEALYAEWTLQGYDDPERRFVALANGKEPLLPWLGMVWMALGAEPLTAVRLVSIAAGLVTLAAVTLLGLRLGGWPVGLAAAGVCAVLPFFVVNDVVGIYDGLATATVAAALVLQLELARRVRLDLALLLGFAFAAGLLTKQTTYASLALLPVSLLVLDWRAPGRTRRLAAWIGAVAAALTVAFVGYSVMLLSEFYDDLGEARDSIYPTHPLGAALGDAGHWLEMNWPEYRSALAGYVTPTLLLAAAIGTGLALRRVPRTALVLVAWMLGPIALAVLLVDIPYPRYLLVAIPPLVVLAGYGLVEVATWLAAQIGGQRGIAAAAAAVALAFAPALAFDLRVVADPGAAEYPSLDDAGYATGWAAGQPWPPLADELRERSGGRPLVVVLGEQHPSALQLLLREEPEIRLVRLDDPEAPEALLGVENGVPLPDPEGAVAWQRVWQYPRPRQGTQAALYEAVVEVDGRRYRTPDALRAGLGLLDDRFDALLARRPDILRWYGAWYEQRGAGT